MYLLPYESEATNSLAPVKKAESSSRHRGKSGVLSKLRDKKQHQPSQRLPRLTTALLPPVWGAPGQLLPSQPTW